MSLEDGKKDAVQETMAKEASTTTQKQSYLVSNIIILLAVVIVAGAWFFSYKMTSVPSGVIMESSEGDFTISMPEEWQTEVIAVTADNPIYGIFAANETQDASAFVLAVPAAEGVEVNAYVDEIAMVYADFGFEFTSREEVELNGTEGVLYEASLADAIGTYYQRGFITIQNGIKYSVLAQGSTESLSELEKVYKNTVDSFTLTK